MDGTGTLQLLLEIYNRDCSFRHTTRARMVREHSIRGASEAVKMMSRLHVGTLSLKLALEELDETCEA